MGGKALLCFRLGIFGLKPVMTDMGFFFTRTPTLCRVFKQGDSVFIWGSPVYSSSLSSNSSNSSSFISFGSWASWYCIQSSM